MTTIRTITYGPGGYNSSHPDDNIVSVEELEVPDAPPTPDEQLSALAVAARMVVTDTVRAGGLPLETLAQLAPIYPLWEPGLWGCAVVGQHAGGVRAGAHHPTGLATGPDSGAVACLSRYRQRAGDTGVAGWHRGLGGRDVQLSGDRLPRRAEPHDDERLGAAGGPGAVAAGVAPRPMVAGRRCH